MLASGTVVSSVWLFVEAHHRGSLGETASAAGIGSSQRVTYQVVADGASTAGRGRITADEKSARCSQTVAQSCFVAAMLEHPAFADCRASRRQGPRCWEGIRVDVPTEVSEFLVDTLESHGDVFCVVLWVVVCGGAVSRRECGCGKK